LGSPFSLFSLFFQQKYRSRALVRGGNPWFPAVGRVGNSKTVRCSLLFSAVLVDTCNKLKYRFPENGLYLDWEFL